MSTKGFSRKASQSFVHDVLWRNKTTELIRTRAEKTEPTLDSALILFHKGHSTRKSVAVWPPYYNYCVIMAAAPIISHFLSVICFSHEGKFFLPLSFLHPFFFSIHFLLSSPLIVLLPGGTHAGRTGLEPAPVSSSLLRLCRTRPSSQMLNRSEMWSGLGSVRREHCVLGSFYTLADGRWTDGCDPDGEAGEKTSFLQEKRQTVSFCRQQTVPDSLWLSPTLSDCLRLSLSCMSDLSGLVPSVRGKCC